jgi:hypothetical protein
MPPPEEAGGLDSRMDLVATGTLTAAIHRP